MTSALDIDFAALEASFGRTCELVSPEDGVVCGQPAVICKPVTCRECGDTGTAWLCRECLEKYWKPQEGRMLCEECSGG